MGNDFAACVITHLSSSELKRCLSDGIVKSRVPLGTGGKLEFASNSLCPFCSVFTSSSSSSDSLSEELDESSRMSETSDEVGSLGSEMSSWRLESGGDVGSGRSTSGQDVVRGGSGGGAFSSS